MNINLGIIWSSFWQSDFVRKVAQTTMTRIGLFIVGSITGIIVTRILGPEGRGVYAVAVTIGNLGVQFGNLGLHAANVYYVASKPKLLPRLLGNSLAVGLGIGGIGAVLTWLLLSHIFPNASPVTGVILALALVWVPIGLANLLLQNLLIGINKISLYNKIDLSNSLLSLGLIGTLILVRAVSVETVFSAGLIALVVALIWTGFELRKHLLKSIETSWQWFHRSMNYGLKAYLAALFSFLVIKVDLLMVNHYLGQAETGFYAVASGMADILYMFPVVVGTILFPTLAGLKTNHAKWQRAKAVIKVLTLIMIPLGLLAVILSAPAIRILYGEAFLPASPAFIWLVPAIIALAINVVFMNYFAATGMPIFVVYSTATAALVNVILNFKLIPLLGIIGAALSSVIAYGLMLIFSGGYLYGQSLLRPKN